MSNEEAIAIIRRYIIAENFPKVSQISVVYNYPKYLKIASLLGTKWNRSYFLKVKYKDHSEELLPVKYKEKDEVKKSVTPFNYSLVAV